MWQEYIKGMTEYRGVRQKEPVTVTLNPETLSVATCCHKIVAGMKAFTCKDCGKDRALDVERTISFVGLLVWEEGLER